MRLALNQQALVENWRALSALSGSASAGAAVKADAYGVGAVRVVKALHEAGCRDFYVAHWGEVEALLPLVPPATISVLHGPLTAQDAAYARATGVKPVINSPQQARLWHEAGGGPCDLMIDTGINRLGVTLDDLGDAAIAALDVDVLMSHLASADEDSPLNEVQRQRWLEAGRRLPHRRKSLANSAGIVLGAAYHGDLTRPGLALYGGVPRAELAPHIRQVVTPEVALIQTRRLNPGDSVGYNAAFTASEAMEVGVVSLGYADGYLRCWSGKGAMRSGAAALPVLGRISMDMTVIDLRGAPGLKEGDWVSVDYSLPQAAAESGLSQYELLTLLGPRFSR